MKDIPDRCIIRHVLVDPSRIHLLRFTVEACEGTAVVTTIDSKLGLIKLSIAPGCAEDVDLILEAESKHLGIRLVAVDDDL